MDPNQELVVSFISSQTSWFLLQLRIENKTQWIIDKRKTQTLYGKICGGFVSYLKGLFQKPWLSTVPLLSDRLSVSVCRPCPPVEMGKGIKQVMTGTKHYTCALVFVLLHLSCLSCRDSSTETWLYRWTYVVHLLRLLFGSLEGFLFTSCINKYFNTITTSVNTNNTFDKNISYTHLLNLIMNLK